MATISDDIRAPREEILTIAARHGAHNVRIFGSVARGEARPDSDLGYCSMQAPIRHRSSPVGWSTIWKLCSAAGSMSSSRTGSIGLFAIGCYVRPCLYEG
jgi:hypothetical protein